MMIEKICREHTDLSETDIRKIQEVAGTIPAVADLMSADVFIDCLTRDPDVAVVVAQAKPTNGRSRYKRSVVGEFARRSNEPAALRTLDVGMPTMDMLARTQEDKDVRQNVSAITNDQGKIIACLIAETDVTKDIKAKRNLSLLSKTTEQLTKTLIHNRNKDQGIPYHVTDGIVIFNHLGIASYANPVAKEIYKKLGYINKIEGLKFSNAALEEISFKDILSEKQTISTEVKFGNLILNIKYAVMKSEKIKKAGVAMLIRDETEFKAKEKELILKSVAIKEIHHRVKNNLQTIASLLRLQSRRINNDEAKKAFSESISRVLSIAATHEILAQNGVDDVDLMMMLKRIMHSVIGHSLEQKSNIKVSISGDEIRINSDTATSIALVVNELIQNCFKYAFVGREQGNIRIELRRGNTYSNISIIDDGVGFNTKREANVTSLGNKIVQQIVLDKLRGNLNIDSGSNGTKVFFDFFCGPVHTDLYEIG